MKTVIFTWAFIYCAIAGPGVLSEWDITGDGVFDLRDVAAIQNGWNGTKAVIVLPEKAKVRRD